MQHLGKNALCAKSNIKSAFRFLPIYQGIQLNGNFYIEKMLPMGLSQSCSYFEKCSSFIDWAVKRESNSENIDHYLNDFSFAGSAGTNDSQVLLDTFFSVCDRLSVPLAKERTVVPMTIIE